MSDTASQRVALARGFLEATRVGLIGASNGERDRWSFNARMTRSLLRSRFEDLVLVGRNTSRIEGRPVVPDIAEHDGPAGDLCVVVVPKRVLVETIEHAADVGWQRFLIISGELDGNDRAALARLTPSRIRLWGPNCIGFTVTERQSWVMSSDVARDLRPGRPKIAVAGQSGGALGNISSFAEEAGLDISHVLSTGEEADIGIEALLSYFAATGTTDGVILFVEQARRPVEFLAALDECAAAGLPVVVIKVGRSTRARAAAQSHTGALVGDWDEFAAAVRAHGGVLASSLREAANVAALLVNQPRLRTAGRVAFFSSSGGSGALACDIVESSHLTLAPMTDSAATLRELALAPTATLNPFDSSTGGGTPKTLGPYLDAIERDDSVDSVVFLHSSAVYQEFIVDTLTGGQRTTPLVMTWPSVEPALRDRLLDARIPVFEDVGDTIAWLSAAAADAPSPSPQPLADNESAEDDSWLTYGEGMRLLQDAGVPVPARWLWHAGDDVAKLAAQVTAYPVVVKASELRGHKARHGGVRAGLADRAALAGALTDMSARFTELVVEQHAPPGAEVLVTAMAGPFGGLLVIGFGGAHADVLGRQVVLPARSTETEITAAIRRSLLGPFLGDRAGPVAALAARLGDLLDAGGLAGVELNPVIVSAGGALACDVKAQRARSES